MVCVIFSFFYIAKLICLHSKIHIIGRILPSGAIIGPGGIVMNEGDLTLTKGSGIIVEKNGGLVVEGMKYYF